MEHRELNSKRTQRLRQHVDVLAELIGERNTIRPAGLEQARQYLRRELRAMGYVVREQPFQTHERPALNLEVVLPGSNPNAPTLVIGAHYDSARGTPGADDNASAVAILLEIACGLSGKCVKRTTRLVFFDCEEAPHFNYNEMGSQFHAAELKRSGEKVLGMICLESLGYFPTGRRNDSSVPWPVRWTSRIFGQRYVVIVSDLGSMIFGWKFVWRFATSGLFPFLPAALKTEWVPAIALSDHRAYWEQNISALMITDTAHLRNPNYHQPSDRLATLDVRRMAKLCDQIARAVGRLVK